MKINKFFFKFLNQYTSLKKYQSNYFEVLHFIDITFITCWISVQFIIIPNMSIYLRPKSEQWNKIDSNKVVRDISIACYISIVALISIFVFQINIHSRQFKKIINITSMLCSVFNGNTGYTIYYVICCVSYLN